MNKLKTAIRITELDGLSDSFVRNFKADTKAANDTFVTTTMAELEKQSGLITTAILQDKTHSTLQTADNARDEAIKTLGMIISAYAVFPIASKKELAIPLKAIFDKYVKAGITGANYTSESSLIESMLGDFAASSVAENIKGLEGVQEAIASVRSAQDEFTKANTDYIKSTANKSASASAYKKTIIAIINDKLIPYLDAMLIAGNENCTDFAKSVEAEINRANDMIAKRRSKKTDADTAENAE